MFCTNHQERGRDNFFGSGRVGGWHDHLRDVLRGRTPRLINAGRRLFGTAGRFIGLLWAGGFEKKRVPTDRARGDLGLQPILFSTTVACKNATPLTHWKTSGIMSFAALASFWPCLFSNNLRDR